MFSDTYIGRGGEVKVAPRFTVAPGPHRTSLYLMARIHGPSLELPWRSFTPLTVSSVYPDGTRARCRVCEDLGANRLTVTKGNTMQYSKKHFIPCRIFIDGIYYCTMPKFRVENMLAHLRQKGYDNVTSEV